MKFDKGVKRYLKLTGVKIPDFEVKNTQILGKFTYTNTKRKE